MRRALATLTAAAVASVTLLCGSASAAETSFYVDGNNDAGRAAAAASNAGDRAALQMMSDTPTAIWLGNWNSTATVASRVSDALTAAAAKGQTPIFTLYDIPLRDCGSWSAGGAPNAAAYRDWVAHALSGLKGRRAYVIVEPDALAGIDCLTHAQAVDRLKMISWVVGQLGRRPNVRAYVDSGHMGWKSPEVMAARLRAVGVSRVRGFSVNVAAFASNGVSEAYGAQIHKLVGGHFVIDSSRNGAATAATWKTTAATWCNPSGQRLGTRSTTVTGDPLVDALLWIKIPGQSDGSCNGGPVSGAFWTSYALALAGR